MKNLLNFSIDFWVYAVRGGPKLYMWLMFLSFFILLMFYGTYLQFTQGMIVTHYNDQVSWGLYEAQFIFLVGVAAAAVTVVFPSYIYHHKKLKEVVVIGEMLAISAVVMVFFFIFAHMGRPDKFWHMMPVVGIFNFPDALLTWDVLVLNGYFVLNLIAAFYYLYMKYTGQEINRTFYIPLIYLCIVWAISIHTVTAFLINTLPARPMWFHSMMPIKFITTAFAAGPSMIIIAFIIIRKHTKLKIDDGAIDMLSQIVTWSLGMAMFLSMSEAVTELYQVTEHSFSIEYLIFGYGGFSSLVIWYWTSIFLMVSAFIMLLFPRLRRNQKFWLPLACAFTFAGIWIDKGMGLVVPAFVPTPIGEFSEYSPSYIEIINTAGYWSAGLFLFTLLSRGAIGVLLGEVKLTETSGFAAFSRGKAKVGKAITKSMPMIILALSAALLSIPAGAYAMEPIEGKEPTECFESREVYSTRQRIETAPGVQNIKCSKATGGVLWFGDPFDHTEPMGELPVEGAYSHEPAVIKPRTKQLKWFLPCSSCHNGETVPWPKNKRPRKIMMHQDIVADSMKLQHGRGAIWCLDCHNPKNRDTLIDHKGDEISFNQPQRLCGKCHGQIYGDWRAGIHGKRIGYWAAGDKKRWWVCTECHNPHMVQVKRFQPIKPEPAPEYPRTRTKADYEELHK
jgi:molybdopterin-containing oxidoreductase family membrane subunit